MKKVLRDSKQLLRVFPANFIDWM